MSKNASLKVPLKSKIQEKKLFKISKKILTHREIEELLKQFMFYNKVTIVGINEALCRCYQVFWAGEAMNLLY